MAFSKPKILTFLIAVLSLVGMILLLATEFGGFYLTGYYSGYRYSCLGCAYNTGGDTAAIIIGAILLGLQMIIAINTLLPKPFLKALVGSKFIPILGIATIVMMIIGAASFGGAYESLYEWWLGTGFYGGLIAGILNTVLAVLSFRVKE